MRYKISEFATLSRVSAKMLRHYAAIGLLMPDYTDPVTGYRYYSAEQVPRLNRIVVLKDLGFSLEQIVDLLDADLSPAQLCDALRQRRAEVAQRIAEEQRRLAELDRRLTQLATAQLPAVEVVLRPIPAAPVASARAIVANDQDLAELLAEVEDHVARLRARAAFPATVVYHGCMANAMEVEVAVPLAAPIPDASWVQPAILPGEAQMACVVYVGDDAALSVACDALRQWVAAHGYQIAGAYRERYLRLSDAGNLALPPAFVASHPGAAIAELQLPVVPVQAA
jgi:DNA-binding transcriptional MerR regulator